MSFLNKYFVRKNWEKDLVIVVIITFLPFVFFAYNVVPETRIWSTNFFTIDSGYFYNNANLFIWFVCVKLMTITVLTIWFITSIYKWRYILFFPILMEFYKLHSIIKTGGLGYNYNSNLKETLIFSIPFIIIIFFLSNRVNYYNSSKPINEKINNEINEELIKLSKFDTKYYKSIRKEFIELKNNNQNIDKKEYLIKLIKLRDKMAV